MKVDEELESMITNDLMNGDSGGFIKKLKVLKVKPTEIAGMELFGDQELSDKVSKVKEALDRNKSGEKELDKLQSYLKMISNLKTTLKTSKKNFSENEGNVMITDRELDGVSAENVSKINEKVINMEDTLDRVEATLDGLVQQQKDIQGIVDPESLKSPEDKIDDLRKDVSDLTEAFSYVCDYINYAEQAAAMDPAAMGGAPAAGAVPPAGDPGMAQSQAYYDGFQAGEGSAPGADLAAQLGYAPGSQGWNDFLLGYQNALGIGSNQLAGVDPAQQAAPAAPGAAPQAGVAPAAPGAAPAAFSQIEGITYSKAHDAFFSEYGDIYTYSAEKDCYINQDNEKLCFSKANNVYYSEELDPEMKFALTVFSVDGTPHNLYMSDDSNTLFSDSGESVVYNKDQNAFFSNTGETLFDNDAYFSNGCDLEVEDVDQNGNAICYSKSTGDYYFYSLEDNILFSEDDLQEIADDDDDDDYDDEDIDVVRVNANDKTIIVIDKDNDLRVKDEGDEVTIMDDDTGDSDNLQIVEKDDDDNAICCSQVTGQTYLYSAKENRLYPVSDKELVNFSQDNTQNEVTTFSQNDSSYVGLAAADNRSDAAITTFSLIENTAASNGVNAMDRYEALKNYLDGSDY